MNHLLGKDVWLLFCLGCTVILPYALWTMYYTTNFSAALPKDHMYGMVGWGGATLGTFTQKMLYNFTYELFTTPGFLLAWIGIVLTIFTTWLSSRDKALLLSWLICGASYLIIVATGNIQHHYYQLPFVPLSALYIGVSIDFFIHKWTILRKYTWVFIGITTALIILYIAQFMSIVTNFFYSSISYASEIPTIQNIIRREEPIVVSGYFRDPTFLDLSGRVGWVFNSELLEAEKLTDEFRGNPIDQSVLSPDDQLSLQMPGEGFYRYLVPFIQRKKQLGAKYLILLRKEMPRSYDDLTQIIAASFHRIYYSKEISVFDIH